MFEDTRFKHEVLTLLRAIVTVNIAILKRIKTMDQNETDLLAAVQASLDEMGQGITAIGTEHAKNEDLLAQVASLTTQLAAAVAAGTASPADVQAVQDMIGKAQTASANMATAIAAIAPAPVAAATASTGTASTGS